MVNEESNCFKRDKKKMQRVEEDKDEIISLYCEQKWSKVRIAQKYGITTQVLRNYLEKWQVNEMCSKIENLRRHKKEIAKAYQVDKVSRKELANLYGVSVSLLDSFLYKEHIVKRQRSSPDVAKFRNDKEHILYLYVEQHVPLKDIAAAYGVSMVTASSIVNREWGVYKLATEDIKRLEEYKEEILYDLNEKSMTIKELAEKYSVSFNVMERTIHRRWKVNKQHMYGKLQSHLAEITEEFLDKKCTAKALAAKYHVSNSWMCQFLRKNGVKKYKKK